MNEWTRNPPKESGWYWFLNVLPQATARSPVAVEVTYRMMGQLYCRALGVSVGEISRKCWWQKIEVPKLPEKP